jgi:hypothetical protein
VEEIFKQYAAPIIIAIVIVALVAIVTLLLTTGGPVATGFQSMITDFMAKAKL